MGDEGMALCVRGLRKTFEVRRSRLLSRSRGREGRDVLIAVDGVSFDLEKGAVLGLIGESGSGKSTLAECLLRLEEPDEGQVLLDGVDLTRAPRGELRSLRQRAQMVFQDPYSSLNPRLTVGAAILEAGKVHQRVESGGEVAFVAKLLDAVGLSPEMASRRPAHLSGGQRQRVAVARALAVGPMLLIADEVTSALDVSVQAELLHLFAELRERLGLSLIFISHQLSAVAQLADSVAIMYLGRIVEMGSTADVFGDPQHPYTRALLDANPVPDPSARRAHSALEGELPSLESISGGCRVRTRCAYRSAVCDEYDPELRLVGDDHYAACHVLPFAPEIVQKQPLMHVSATNGPTPCARARA